MDLSYWTILGRLLLAMFFAALIGLDRELTGKPAGLRTMMLVGLGSAAFTVLGTASVSETLEALNAMGGEARIQLDTSRVIAGIVGGVGFLGAGTIIQSRGKVHGVTTAAGIWVTAAIGVACGLGEYAIAITTGICAIVAMVVLRFATPPSMHKPQDQAEEENEVTE